MAPKESNITNAVIEEGKSYMAIWLALLDYTHLIIQKITDNFHRFRRMKTKDYCIFCYQRLF